MNEIDDSFPQTVFDRLVDGELSHQEEQALLARFDERPENWRRCALAFLEARTWQQSFSTMLGGAAPSNHAQNSGLPSADVAATATSTTMTTTGGRPSFSRKVLTATLVALSMLAVFALGTYFGTPPTDSPAETGSRPIMTLMPERPDTTPGPHSEMQSAPAKVDNTRPPTAAIPQFAIADPSVSIVGVVRMNGDSAQDAAVPVFAESAAAENWLRHHPAPLSADEQQRLERQGYRVDQDRRVLSVDMTDGNRLMIPIDTVNVQYVGTPVY